MREIHADLRKGKPLTIAIGGQLVTLVGKPKNGKPGVLLTVPCGAEFKPGPKKPAA